MPKKHCAKCDTSKSIEEFYMCKTGILRHCCKQCDNAASRAYKAANRQKISKYNEKWKSSHIEEVSKYNHKYNKNNRPAIRTRQTLTRRERIKNDPKFHLTCNLRGELYSYIKAKGNYRHDFMKQLMGCDWDSFEMWLRFLFEDKHMSLDNYGEYWSIDHIMPCCIFDVTDDEQKLLCFNWSNLRPTLTLDNQSKTGKVIPEIITKYYKLSKKFIKLLPKEERKNYN